MAVRSPVRVFVTPALPIVSAAPFPVATAPFCKVIAEPSRETLVPGSPSTNEATIPTMVRDSVLLLPRVMTPPSAAITVYGYSSSKALSDVSDIVVPYTVRKDSVLKL